MPTLLLVDDSAVARRAVSRRMSSEGFEIQEAGSAREARAIDVSRTTGALLDVELGDGDGASIAAELQSRQPGMQVAFFTSGASPELIERCRAHGPVFSKPQLAQVVEWARGLARVPQPPPTK